MQVMVEREAGRQLTGRVEIDDAYLGGEHHGGTWALTRWSCSTCGTKLAYRGQ